MHSRTESPAGRSLLETARGFSGEISETAEQHDADGRLSAIALGALRDANLFGLLTPRELGGIEAPPTEALEILEEVSRAEGSTGWILTTGVLANGFAGTFLSDSAVAAIFGSGMPLIAGAGAPLGRAQSVEGGFRFGGRWSYGSGVRHATHLHSGGMIVDAQGNVSKDAGPHIFVTPIVAGTLDDEWDVIGLRGSGSVDYEIDDHFVPDGYEHPILKPQQRRGGTLFRIGLAGIVAISHTGFFLGIGRRVLDELVATVRGQGGRISSLADSRSFQEGYGRAEALYCSARALVFESWRSVERHIEKHSSIDARSLTTVQMAMCQMAWASAEAASFAYRAGGGVSLRNTPLQRAFRDCIAGRQHVRVSDTVLAGCARQMLSWE